jgi:phage-related protein
VGDPHQLANAADGSRVAMHSGQHLVALHGFIKKTRATPDEDLALARKRQKELQQ